jgi:MFS transporter, FSR family, fosmidomycin resistance protein
MVDMERSSDLNTEDRPLIEADGAAAASPAVENAGPLGGAEGLALGILIAISVSHLLNDMIQSLIQASYPLLKESYGLTFAQIGLITFTFQVTASVLQPAVGIVTDRRPQPFSLAIGMGFTLTGLLLLSASGSFGVLLLSVGLIGIGSSVFHPESSRVARMASGGRYGLAQSVFQVGGNFGTALGPLLAAFIVVPRGQASIVWFSAAALAGILILTRVGVWYGPRRNTLAPRAARAVAPLPRKMVVRTLAVLAALIFSKFVYTVSLSSYYHFYLMETFHISVESAQILLFVFLGAVAVGTVAGGPIGDRFGRKFVIWFSILGVLPFTLALPYANLFWTVALSVIIGVVLSSAFSAIVVYGQELVPGKVGTVAGLFFGFAFGVAGLGAAVLGQVADMAGIAFVYKVCGFLPVIGLLTWFLPDVEAGRRAGR